MRISSLTRQIWLSGLNLVSKMKFGLWPGSGFKMRSVRNSARFHRTVTVPYLAYNAVWVFFWFSVRCFFRGLTISIHIRIHHHFFYFWVLVSGSLSAKFLPGSNLVAPLVTMFYFFNWTIGSQRLTKPAPLFIKIKWRLYPLVSKKRRNK